MKLLRMVGYIFGVLSITGCEGSAVNASTPEWSLAEKASLDAIFTDIKSASRESFERDDWSIMARLYPPGALACWDTSGEAHRFGFLSMQGIPETAEYSVGSLDNFVFGNQDTSQMGGTHFMAIKYTETFLEGCELPVQKRWPTRYFYLKRHDGVFSLVHYCPTKEQVEEKSISRVWPVTSGKRALEVAANMPIEKAQTLRDLIRKDQFPLNAMDSIQREYGISEDESAIVIQQVCRANQKQR